MRSVTPDYRQMRSLDDATLCVFITHRLEWWYLMNDICVYRYTTNDIKAAHTSLNWWHQLMRWTSTIVWLSSILANQLLKRRKSTNERLIHTHLRVRYSTPAKRTVRTHQPETCHSAFGKSPCTAIFSIRPRNSTETRYWGRTDADAVHALRVGCTKEPK